MTRKLDDLTALFFDSDESKAQCRLCENAQQIWLLPYASTREQMHQAMNEIEFAARKGLHVVMSLSYESYTVFSAAKGLNTPHKPRAHPEFGDTPFLQAVAFSRCEMLTPSQARDWLTQHSARVSTHLDTPISSTSEDAFIHAITEIRERIAAGQTYQVNYTYPYTSRLRAYVPESVPQDAALFAAFSELITGLNVPYAGVFLFPESSVLSFSPELFFELAGNTLTTRPMKGTAPTGQSAAQNAQRVLALSQDAKNRAENLMIVDLMRNDVARLPQTTRVTVPDLFTVRPYGAVLQMTSTVQADLSIQPSVFELFNALFPCGSITGAPKHETLRIIDTLEPYARGAYCGAIGMIHMAEQNNAQLHAMFSVAIRTLEMPAQARVDELGLAHWPIQCSVGAGITYDSDAQEEWQECVLKSQFFARHTQAFELIETMRVHIDSNLVTYVPKPWLSLHHQRIKHSARKLGFVWNDGAFFTAVNAACARTDAIQDQRLRLSMNKLGVFSSQISELEALPDVLRFDIYPTRIDSCNPMLAHKTTMRSTYNRALLQAKTRKLFDTVFVNEKGELTEGARSCLYVQLDGAWYTPALSCGVLPSVARAWALTQSDMRVTERVLFPEDLHNAQAIMLGNALYGLRAAKPITI